MIVLTLKQLDSLREKLAPYAKKKEEEYLHTLQEQWHLYRCPVGPTVTTCSICPSCEACYPDDDFCACDYD